MFELWPCSVDIFLPAPYCGATLLSTLQCQLRFRSTIAICLQIPASVDTVQMGQAVEQQEQYVGHAAPVKQEATPNQNSSIGALGACHIPAFTQLAVFMSCLDLPCRPQLAVALLNYAS